MVTFAEAIALANKGIFSPPAVKPRANADPGTRQPTVTPQSDPSTGEGGSGGLFQSQIPATPFQPSISPGSFGGGGGGGSAAPAGTAPPPPPPAAPRPFQPPPNLGNPGPDQFIPDEAVTPDDINADPGSTNTIGDGGTGDGTGGGGGNAADDHFNTSVFATISLLLNRYGLGELEGWARSLVTTPDVTADEIEILLFDQPAFKKRFPAIAMIEELNKGGAKRGQISAEDYLGLEANYFELLAYSGLEGAFYTPSRVAEWIFEGVSPAELSRRVTVGYTAMALASAETRAFFRDTYGVEGDTAMAAYMLDPDNVAEELVRQVEVAQIGGRSRIAGIGIGASGAERLAELGVTAGQAGSGFQNINARSGLFRETASERADLSKAGEGFRAQFGLDDGTAHQTLNQRLATRKSAFRGGGGAFIGQRNSGFGEA